MKNSETIQKTIVETKASLAAMLTEISRIKGLAADMQSEIDTLTVNKDELTQELQSLIVQQDEMKPLILIGRATQKQADDLTKTIDGKRQEISSLSQTIAGLLAKHSDIVAVLRSDESKANTISHHGLRQLNKDHLSALATEKLPEFEKQLADLIDSMAYLFAIDQITQADMFKPGSRFILPLPGGLDRKEYFFDQRGGLGVYPAHELLRDQIKQHKVAFGAG